MKNLLLFALTSLASCTIYTAGSIPPTVPNQAVSRGLVADDNVEGFSVLIHDDSLTHGWQIFGNFPSEDSAIQWVTDFVPIEMQVEVIPLLRSNSNSLTIAQAAARKLRD